MSWYGGNVCIDITLCRWVTFCTVMLKKQQPLCVKGGFFYEECKNNTLILADLVKQLWYRCHCFYLLLFSRRHLACGVHAEMAVHVSRSMTERIIDAYVHLRILLEKIAKIVSIIKAWSLGSSEVLKHSHASSIFIVEKILRDKPSDFLWGRLVLIAD